MATAPVVVQSNTTKPQSVRLRAELFYSKPLIWREFDVPISATLWDLHCALTPYLILNRCSEDFFDSCQGDDSSMLAVALVIEGPAAPAMRAAISAVFKARTMAEVSNRRG